MKIDTSKVTYIELTSKENLRTLWSDEARTSVARGRDGQTPQQFLNRAIGREEQISSQLRDASYNFVSYRQFLKNRGANREPRQISIPAARDRATLKILLRYLHSTVPESRGELPQPKISRLLEAVRSGKFHYFVRIDIQNFYPSISHSAAFDALDKYVDHEPARQLLKKSIQIPTLGLSGHGKSLNNTLGVPQGLSISNAIAEIVLSDIDKQYSALDGVEFFRYVDDILILTRRKCHMKLFKEISLELKSRGLRPHPLKSGSSKSTFGSLSDPVDFLGYSISKENITVRESSIKQLKSRISLLFIQFRNSSRAAPEGINQSEWYVDCVKRLAWFLDMTIAGCILDGKRRGWIHYFSLLSDFSLLRSLDHFVQRKIDQFSLDDRFTVKKFIKSYRAASKSTINNMSIVENFDKYSTSDQIGVLTLIFRYKIAYIDTLTEEEVSALFFRRVRKELIVLEVDLSLVY